MKEMFNCTSPWLQHMEGDLKICGPESSEAAAKFSSTSREYEECSGPPCSRMEVDAKFKTKTNTSNSMLSFIYPREIIVVEEFLTDSIISLVAEIGGYLGMLVGVSL